MCPRKRSLLERICQPDREVAFAVEFTRQLPVVGPDGELARARRPCLKQVGRETHTGTLRRAGEA